MPFDPKIVNFRVWRRKREIEDDRIDRTQVRFYSHKNVNTSSSNNQKKTKNINNFYLQFQYFLWRFFRESQEVHKL